MLTPPRIPNALRTGATKDVLLRLFTPSGSLHATRNFPIRNLTASRHLTSSPNRLLRNTVRAGQLSRNAPMRRSRGIRFNSNHTQKNVPSPYELAGHPPPKKDGKFKELSRKYGWTAVGVYFGLSILDFPFCFLAVRWLGTERIVAAEEWVVDGFWDVTERAAPGARESYEVWSAHLKEQYGESYRVWSARLRERYREWRGLKKLPVDVPAEAAELNIATAAHGQHRHHEASLGTQLALAYALHKSLIFFRLPLAASITPGIAKWLRKRGWAVGNRQKK
ncbi:DUF1279 super [Friedmanniomyces endolithicus]|uniref:DUF1279 super n=2 Tax=Friedmanniomyces endolithicus TaxID=329885 RepID=A0AAN6R2X9_9PEZI|nr:DUF1279 super [Friedmanniomyces endolithicus]KAK0281125.1 DUF1279 super [Friedmanniomyces endolithicus]KAK0295087.1 DUF1279 super [Friedmanniomyces endolithicus]KAK0317358.1 DUF1279 super [Friedmanniomyces endolithicus]KAK0931332.1 DUF1279 super [Friedmanniomyces endolithicus]